MKKGFTLIELAIALFIMGVMSVGLVNFLKSSVEQGQIENQKNILFSAREYILHFAEGNKRLPTQTEFDAMNFRTNNGHPLFYIADPALQTSLCSANTASLSVTDPNGFNRVNIAFFLSTYGINNNLEIAPVGNNIPIPEWNTPINGVGFDDVTDYAAIEDLRFKAECSSLSIANPSLHNADAGVAYSATIIPSGGTGAYSYQVSSTAGGIAISPAGVLSWTNPVAGSYEVDVTVSSGTFPDASKKFVLVVNSASTGTGTGTSTGTGTGTSTGTNGNSGNTNGNNGVGNGNGNGRG